jgi:hypothetical protein
MQKVEFVSWKGRWKKVGIDKKLISEILPIYDILHVLFTVCMGY